VGAPAAADAPAAAGSLKLLLLLLLLLVVVLLLLLLLLPRGPCIRQALQVSAARSARLGSHGLGVRACWAHPICGHGANARR
jgi:hypothetical protein